MRETTDSQRHDKQKSSRLLHNWEEKVNETPGNKVKDIDSCLLNLFIKQKIHRESEAFFIG